jgi:hypothetical protein
MCLVNRDEAAVTTVAKSGTAEQCTDVVERDPAFDLRQCSIDHVFEVKNAEHTGVAK